MYGKHKPALYTYLQTLLIEPNIFKYYREINIQVTFFIFQIVPLFYFLARRAFLIFFIT